MFVYLNVTEKLDCLEVNENQVELKKNHNIFYDVQGQLHICNKNVCLFAIWTSNRFQMHVQRIERDTNFFDNKMIKKLTTFYNDWLLPELVDPRLSRSMQVRQATAP